MGECERKKEGVEKHGKAIGSDKAKGQCGVKLEAENGALAASTL